MEMKVCRSSKVAIASAIAMAICLFGQSPAVAHHSFNALYEVDGDFEIAGEVTVVRWVNPHVRLTVQVSDDGQAKDWHVEAANASVFALRGVPGGLIEVGDSIRVAGRPGKRGRAEVLASNILLKDGRELLVDEENPPRWTDNIIGGPDEQEKVVQRREDASSGIFTVWSAEVGFEDDVEGGVWGGDFKLTAEGAAFRDQFDPAADDNPFINCIRGIPEIMVGFGPLEFVDQGDRILLRFEEFDIRRPIMMGPDAEANRPPKSAARPYGDVGYSTGHWEGDDTLVVRTTGMNFPYYEQSGLAQTSDAEIVERWTLADAGNALEYELTVTDPATFINPVIKRKTWHWAPDRRVEPYNCVA